jgi:molybdopterin converting factor small subunit
MNINISLSRKLRLHGYGKGRTENSPQGIRVLVHVFDDLRRRIGRARIDVHLEPGTTLEGLFQHLAKEHDERFMDICVRLPGEPGISVVILNGRTLQLPRDLQRKLEMEDLLYLIPPIAGG